MGKTPDRRHPDQGRIPAGKGSTQGPHGVVTTTTTVVLKKGIVDRKRAANQPRKLPPRPQSTPRADWIDTDEVIESED